MGFKEYNEYDALGLAELVRKKEVSAEELLKPMRQGWTKKGKSWKIDIPIHL